MGKEALSKSMGEGKNKNKLLCIKSQDEFIPLHASFRIVHHSAGSGTQVEMKPAALIGPQVHATGESSLLTLETEPVPGAGEVLALRRESTTGIIPNYIRHLTLMPTDNCSFHISSKKPLSTANGDHHRKSQQDRRQGARVCGSPAPVDESMP